MVIILYINDFSSAIESIDKYKIEKFDERHSIEIDGVKYYPLFLVLYAKKALLGKIIRTFTKEAFSHISISFNTSFNTLYSFGTRLNKDENGDITKQFGFGLETFSDKYDEKVKYPSDTNILINCIYFSKEQMLSIRDYVYDMVNNAEKYKYHKMGLVKYAFGKKSGDAQHMFCSQFVAEVLKFGTPIGRDSSLYSPYGILDNDNIVRVWEGFLGNYDKKSFDMMMDGVSRYVLKNRLIYTNEENNE